MCKIDNRFTVIIISLRIRQYYRYKIDDIDNIFIPTYYMQIQFVTI